MVTDYREEKIVIIGLGLTGFSCVEFFLQRGVTPLVIDTRFTPPFLEKLPADVPRQLGSLHEQWLLGATLIVISPGFPISHPALVKAAESGVVIIGDIELFAREVSAPVVAITGTNGKSTVTRMVSEMIAYAGIKVGVGGNIGLPALTLLNVPYQIYVLELSSFQLETTHSLKATAATVLNISEDHMDRYSFRMQQYRSAKLSIYHNAAVCIVNVDDTLNLPVHGLDVRCISISAKKGDYCLSRNATWLMAFDEPLLKCTELHFIGIHNYTNALAAIAIVDALGIPRAASLAALRQFRGLAHRFELVHERRGIRWINDSKATNVASTKAAINSIELKGTLHLLLGGDGKSADLTMLKQCLQGDRVQLYCFGQDGVHLASLRPECAIITETLEQAMHIIASLVMAGDLVLLSPACSSLDQFINFKMRGELFTKLARELG